MTTYYYEFADGYYCWTFDKMSRNDIAWTERTHGKLRIMRKAKA